MHFLRITTPTQLDLREIVTLGMTTKANTDKIGHKGSGLKFTLAYLHRLGSHLDARSKDYHVRSETFDATIRDATHQMIRLRSREDTSQIWEAHITTQAGADTWTEPWFILRELLQNAIDENGSFEIVSEEEPPLVAGTCLQIPFTPELEQAWKERSRWMQPRYPHVIEYGHSDGKGLYYHGFLIFSAGNKWKYSYDVTSFLKRSQLSEDRQLRNGDLHSVFKEIALVAGFNALAPEIYEDAFDLDQKEDVQFLYEGVYYHINNDRKAWGGPDGFDLQRMEDTFRARFGPNAAFHTGLLAENDPTAYYARAAGFQPAMVPYRIGNLLSGYSELKSLSACLPTLQQRLRKVKTTDFARREKLKLAMRLVRKVQPAGVRVEIVEKIHRNDKIECLALADPAAQRIQVLEDLLDQDVPAIAKALIEEYMHLRTGAGDMSLALQRGLIEIIYDLLARRRKVSVENLRPA
jgi:hypothetical protein